MTDQNKELKNQLLEAGRENPAFDIYDLLLSLMVIAPLLKSTVLAIGGSAIIFFAGGNSERSSIGWSLIGYAIGSPTANQKEYQELKSKKKKQISS